MAYLASDSMGGVALYNPSTRQYASSPLPRSPYSIELLEKKIADGFMPIQDLDTPEGKTHLQKFMNESDQPASMLRREAKSDSAGKVSKLLKNILGKVGNKIPGALGILDILGMKKEYDQLMDGTHPMSEFFNESGIGVGDKPTQVYADGGYVISPFVKDIFED